MTKDNLNSETSSELQVIMGEITSLKRDLATLVRGLKSEVSEDASLVRGAAKHLGKDARHAYENLAVEGERSVKAIGRKVEEQPAMSLLIAFAVGFLGSRLLSR